MPATQTAGVAPAAPTLPPHAISPCQHQKDRDMANPYVTQATELQTVRDGMAEAMLAYTK